MGFLVFVGVPLIFPLIIGIIILKFNGSDELNKLAGLFTLKPVLAYPIWFVFYLILSLLFPEGLEYSITNNYVARIPVAPLVAITPGVLLTVGLIFIFKTALKTTKIARVFLLGDIVRWSYTLILSIVMPEPVDKFAFVGFIIPSIYGIAAVVFVNSRAKTLSVEQILEKMENAN